MSFWLTKLRLKNKDSQSLLSLYSQSKHPLILEIISERYSHDLYHYICSLNGIEGSEDIMQNIWLSLINSQSKYVATASVKTFLFGIARKRLIDWQRKHHFFNSVQTDSELQINAIESNELPLDESIYQDQIKTKFDQALMTLSCDKREAFILKQEGFSLDDISDIMQSNGETIKSRIKSAKTIISDALRGDV
ncbi:RNA polymerase sigma factor [Marinicellulosiphila megalodicopiae]|uniref:RNA polymerase sigma factor n=1 Tax=Marinicellulosiphila megalodicopiae TaxID=2724896 RepID=UPI003BAF04D1